MHAEKITPFRPATAGQRLRRAVIQDVGETGYLLDHDRSREARRAFGCLVQPEVGDVVLVDDDPSGVSYVLSVLERPEPRSATLSVPGDMHLVAPTGALSISSRAPVRLASDDHLYLRSDRITVHGRETAFRFAVARAHGDEITASVRAIKTVAETVQSVVRDFLQRARNYVRRTEGNDDVRARNLSRQAEGLIHQHSDNAIITTKKDMRIDGERIHMG